MKTRKMIRTITAAALTLACTSAFANTTVGTVKLTVNNGQPYSMKITGSAAAVIADQVLDQHNWSNEGDGFRTISGDKTVCSETSKYKPKSKSADKDGYVRTSISCVVEISKF